MVSVQFGQQLFNSICVLPNIFLQNVWQVRTPALTSDYLDLVNLFASIGLMVSRIPYRKIVLAIELFLSSQKMSPKGAQIPSSNHVR